MGVFVCAVAQVYVINAYRGESNSLPKLQTTHAHTHTHHIHIHTQRERDTYFGLSNQCKTFSANSKSIAKGIR